MKKLLIIAALMLVMIPGCKEFNGESSDKFPECVGIEGEFNPNSIQKAYSGRIWSQDTSFTTQFIFTEFKYDLYYLSDSWEMWFKRNIGPTTIRYQSAYCFRSSVTDYWFANTGFEFDGQYTSWDFYFEEFDCSVLSGYCTVIWPDLQDTINFNFEGNR